MKYVIAMEGKDILGYSSTSFNLQLTNMTETMCAATLKDATRYNTVEEAKQVINNTQSLGNYWVMSEQEAQNLVEVEEMNKPSKSEYRKALGL